MKITLPLYRDVVVGPLYDLGSFRRTARGASFVSASPRQRRVIPLGLHNIQFAIEARRFHQGVGHAPETIAAFIGRRLAQINISGAVLSPFHLSVTSASTSSLQLALLSQHTTT